MAIIIILLYFIVAFVSYYFLAKRSIFKYKNRLYTDEYKFMCLIWPLALVMFILVSPLYLMEKIDKYIFEKNYNKL